MRRSIRLFCICLIVVTAIACNNEEAAPGRNENLYFDYKVWAEEGMDRAACVFEFKLGGAQGNTVALREPAKLEFDGTQLAADSTRFTGVYYESMQPLAQFNGRHTIVFTDRTNRQYKEEFDFHPFALAAELPEKIDRQPFIIRLKNFPVRETPVRVVLTDTSFLTNDVNETIGVVKGEVVIDEQMLRQVKNGPVILEIYREEERPLKQRTKGGGRISITYGLKREFELVDRP